MGLRRAKKHDLSTRDGEIEKSRGRTDDAPVSENAALPDPTQAVLVRLPSRLLELERRVGEALYRLGKELVEGCEPVDLGPGSDAGVEVEVGEVGVAGYRSRSSQ